MNTRYRIDNGLIVSGPKRKPLAAGFIWLAAGHGAYEPQGRIGNLELTPEQIQKHNRLLADMMWTAMLKNGRGTLYLTHKEVSPGCFHYFVSDWNGAHVIPCCPPSRNLHFVPNTLTRVYRQDVRFRLDGNVWHGTNIGDNQLLRVKRLKETTNVR